MSHCLAGLTLGIFSLVNDWHYFTNESLTSTTHTGTRGPPNNKPNNFASTQRSSPHLSAKSQATASESDVSERPVFGKTRRHTPKPKFSTMVAGGTCSEGQYDLEVKIILLGDYSVGKSSLLRVLARQSSQAGGDRDDDSHSLSNASSRSSVSLGNERLALVDTGSRGALVRSSLQPGGFVDVEFTHQERNVLARIADTGGQERYRSMTTSYYRGAHGCLLMFDVTKEESFTNLDLWIQNIDLYKSCDEFPCILVGTRCKSPARRIVYERAAEFAESRGIPYMELDMDHMTDVRRVFEALLESVTVNLNKQAPIAISIRPEISNKNVHLRKNVVCSC